MQGERVHLTPTQRKVLDGVHSGRLNKQIAFDLGVAEATVKAHMTILMRKLNVRNRTQVAVVAQMFSVEH
nr:LuxR C-terminal-related transcriptional regulator [Polymorphobacter sp.]